MTTPWHLGDHLHAALTAVGITPTRVARWVGGPCGCEERQQRLNALGLWARRVLAGRTKNAAQHLERILEDSEGRAG